MFTNSNLFSYEEGKALNKEIEIYYRDYGPIDAEPIFCLLYTSPSPRDRTRSRMPSSA